MPDREKVIKGLRCIIDGTVRCDSCVYSIDKHGHHSCQQNCASDAIALLKEQEAKKPIYNYKKYGDYLPHCPSCEKVLPNISQYGFAKFCHRCGQAVKWNDNDRY